jgi:predicted Zn-dependent protease with MMP-like domain
MDVLEFERCVVEFLRDMPDGIVRGLVDVGIVVEDFADSTILKEMNVSSPYCLLGLFCGVSLNRRGYWYGNGVFPNVIIIYRKSIEAFCRNDDEVRGKVWEVVAHEVGHYFGFSDQKLKELGY